MDYEEIKEKLDTLYEKLLNSKSFKELKETLREIDEFKKHLGGENEKD